MIAPVLFHRSKLTDRFALQIDTVASCEAARCGHTARLPWITTVRIVSGLQDWPLHCGEPMMLLSVPKPIEVARA